MEKKILMVLIGLILMTSNVFAFALKCSPILQTNSVPDADIVNICVTIPTKPTEPTPNLVEKVPVVNSGWYVWHIMERNRELGKSKVVMSITRGTYNFSTRSWVVN